MVTSESQITMIISLHQGHGMVVNILMKSRNAPVSSIICYCDHIEFICIRAKLLLFFPKNSEISNYCHESHILISHAAIKVIDLSTDILLENQI
jgi:hypothetical protein